MSNNTTSFKPFWQAFLNEQKRDLQKMEFTPNRSPILMAPLEKEANVQFGWEFHTKDDNFDGFQIVVDSPNDPFDWFATFLTKYRDTVKHHLEKEKVELNQFRTPTPKKIRIQFISFNQIGLPEFLQNLPLQQQLIEWGKKQTPPILKGMWKVYHDFTWFIHNRSLPGAPVYKKEFQ